MLYRIYAKELQLFLIFEKRKNRIKLTKMVNQLLAETLRSIGSIRCNSKADFLEQEGEFYGSIDLQGLSLSTDNVVDIIRSFEQFDDNEFHSIFSINFSHNNEFIDEGVFALLENLPWNLSEIHLVDCGICNSGGETILTWLKETGTLRSLYMDHNFLSQDLRSKFQDFGKKNPHILIEV